jgi:mannose-6-phosphate isomerase
MLAEIQQSSDVTYRVYDFDRRDASGQLRELHTDLALDAMDFRCRDDFNIHYDRHADRPSTMAETPYFITRYLRLTRPLEVDLREREAFTIYICVSGRARLRMGATGADLETGQTLLIPAAAPQVQLETDGCELLEVTL